MIFTPIEVYLYFVNTGAYVFITQHELSIQYFNRNFAISKT